MTQEICKRCGHPFHWTPVYAGIFPCSCKPDPNGFITDLGPTPVLLFSEDGRTVARLHRYSYWDDTDRPGKPQVVETSDDLGRLHKKFGRVPVIPHLTEPSREDTE